MSKRKPFGADRCPNCGEYEKHFVGPSFGEGGFYICEPKPKIVAESCYICKETEGYHKPWCSAGTKSRPKRG